MACSTGTGVAVLSSCRVRICLQLGYLRDPGRAGGVKSAVALNSNLCMHRSAQQYDRHYFLNGSALHTLSRCGEASKLRKTLSLLKDPVAALTKHCDAKPSVFSVAILVADTSVLSVCLSAAGPQAGALLSQL